MAYSEDLRRRVVKYVRQGGKKAEAARRFGVSRGCIFLWLSRKNNLKPQRPGPKTANKVDMKKLSTMMQKGSDKMLKEIAEEFDVTESAISKALRRLNISRKKNGALRRGKIL